MVSVTSAENALKSVYLGVVANQLNVNTNPLLAKIEQSTADVWGKEVVKLVPYGINGGIGAGTEEGELPSAGENKYVQFVTGLKNLYGKIEITDKAIRASANNAGAFVNLLNAEMEGLIKASKFNFGRMLYGDGSGVLASVVAFTGQAPAYFTVDSCRNLMEGMRIDLISNEGSTVAASSGKRILSIDRDNNRVYLDVPSSFSYESFNGGKICVTGSYNNEISGLGKIFSDDESIYGVSKSKYNWLKPQIVTENTEISDLALSDMLDRIELRTGGSVDFIACSPKVRKLYQEYLGFYRRNVDVTELEGGVRALTFNGIPVYADRFVEDNALYMLNTKDFTLHQLCDWKWLEGEGGNVLRQNANTATYSATLVKYAELICNKPCAQAKFTNIKSTVTNPFVSVAEV